MDAPEDRAVKLQKVSGGLLAHFAERLPQLLQTEDAEGARRRRATVDSLVGLVRALYNLQSTALAPPISLLIAPPPSHRSNRSKNPLSCSTHTYSPISLSSPRSSSPNYPNRPLPSPPNRPRRRTRQTSTHRYPSTTPSQNCSTRSARSAGPRSSPAFSPTSPAGWSHCASLPPPKPPAARGSSAMCFYYGSATYY